MDQTGRLMIFNTEKAMGESWHAFKFSLFCARGNRTPGVK